MVRFLRRGHGFDKSEEGDEECEVGGHQADSLILEGSGNGFGVEEDIFFHSQGAGAGRPLGAQQIGSVLERSSGIGPRSRLRKDGGARAGPPSGKFFEMLHTTHAYTGRRIHDLIGYLDNFKDQNEFRYVSRDADESEKGAQRKDDKWWLPTVRVPPNGLSDVSKRWLQFQKESVNQVLKAAMAINAQVLMEMEVPEAYIDSLPKVDHQSIYKNITDDDFYPEEFLETMDLSTEHKVLDLKNRIEASIVIWKRKMHDKDSKSSWGSAVSLEKREQFEERAETILLLIKQRFPGLPQTSLDISKIQYNRDVGLSILESYSRILESLAFTVMSRIEDVIYADSLAQNPATKNCNRRQSPHDAAAAKKLNAKEEPEKVESPSSMTLSDFMGWNFEPEPVTKKNSGYVDDIISSKKKPPDVEAVKKVSYIERVEHVGGMRSPTARH
ncbi:hypothetical protein BHM03_00030549 [Ensete ventricosum]|nr:hypothetical protein BHM03_00030549 [Ensete ventricosum]